MTESNLSDKIEPRMFDNGNDVDVLFPKDVKEFIKKVHDDLKKEWCSGFIALSEECFERDWDKVMKKRAGSKFK